MRLTFHPNCSSAAALRLSRPLLASSLAGHHAPRGRPDGRCVRPRRAPFGPTRSHLDRFSEHTLEYLALETVCSDHVDVDLEEVGKFEPEADLVEQ